MAEQNRKDKQQVAARHQAQRVVDLYLDYLFNDRDADDIAWEGRSIIGTFVDHHGEMPSSSGFAGFCKLAAKVDRMRRQYFSTDELWAAEVMKGLDVSLVVAMCMDRSYRGRVKVAIDPFNPDNKVEILWDDTKCAEAMAISPDAMRKRISRGYQELEATLFPVSEAA